MFNVTCNFIFPDINNIHLTRHNDEITIRYDSKMSQKIKFLARGILYEQEAVLVRKKMCEGTDQKHTMEPMLQTGFFGTLNLRLDYGFSFFWITNFYSLHSKHLLF
jgi:hypothetical protein